MDKLTRALDILLRLKYRMDGDFNALILARRWASPADVAEIERELAQSTKAYNDAIELITGKDKL